jgi:hypothetical protein
MVAAAAQATATAFDAGQPPLPGSPVPQDCVWSVHPYPGPVVRRPHGQPHHRLAQLGTLVGRPLNEIVGYAGPPLAEQRLVTGEHHRTWRGRDFLSSRTVAITLHFDRYGVCAGVADEQITTRSSNIGIGIGIAVPLD